VFPYLTLSYSILAALCLDGILNVAIQDFAYTADTFNRFVSDLLLLMNPFPAPNSVLVIDNAPIHKAAALREMVHARWVPMIITYLLV
jgi:hypothetical protein